MRSASGSLQDHCQIVATRLAAGKVIPFLGAGTNLCERPKDASWRADGYLPSGAELARYLADKYEYPSQEDPSDLLRIAQYVDLKAGDATLFEELHTIFVPRDADGYEPNKLHRLLAELPRMLRAQGREVCGQLLITTNYDDTLERAFAAAGGGEGEELDVVYYAANPNEPGRFVHVKPGGEQVEIPNPTDYRDFELERRSVLLKVHGAVDRTDSEGDRYVITEDHYIDYLARQGGVARIIPAHLMAKMRSSHFLFLGYGMRDWNLRVILHSIWSDQKRHFQSWSIQRSENEIDRRFWNRHQVEILDRPLEEWVDAMRAQFE
jgi:SIR2-like domain